MKHEYYVMCQCGYEQGIPTKSEAMKVAKSHLRCGGSPSVDQYEMQDGEMQPNGKHWFI